MLEIVNDVFDLASRVEVQPGQKVRIAKTWTRELIKIIPELRLNDCFESAKQNRTSNYPITEFDLKTAWEKIQADEAAEIEKSRPEKPEPNQVDVCKYKSDHINAEGQVEIMNPKDFSKTVVVPCKFCRLKAYFQWEERFYAANKVAETSPAVLTDQKTVDKKIENLTEKFTLVKPKIAEDVRCKNCGNLITGKFVRLSVDFIVCISCNQDILRRREPGENENENLYSK